MSNLQESYRHILPPRLSRRNHASSYQHFPDLPAHSSRVPPSHHRRRRGTQHNRSQSHTRRRNRSHNREREIAAETELWLAVKRFLDKYYSNQMYTLIIFLIRVLMTGGSTGGLALAGFASVVLAVSYFVRLIRAYNEAMTRIEERRIEYKLFEFGVAAVLVFLSNDWKSSKIYVGILGVFLLLSYMLKAITAYNCNHSEVANLINHVNRAILLIRMFIFLQGSILLFQVAFKNPFPLYMAYAPILIIALIISVFAMKLLSDIFLLERSQIFSSNPCEKIMGIIWIFGNLCILSVLFFVTFIGFALDSPSQRTEFRFYLIVIIWCAISLLLTHSVRNAVFEICRALSVNVGTNNVETSQPSPVEEDYEQVHYVMRISNTYFRKATEEEINKFSEDIELAEKQKRDNDLEAGVETKTEEKAKCIVCYRKLARAVYMECGHGGVCFTCAKKMNRRTRECHLCRQKIKAILVMNVKNNKGNLYEIVDEVRNRE